MSIEAMRFARNWIAEKPELRPCSAGKVVSVLTTTIAAAEKVESEKDALLRQALGALEAYSKSGYVRHEHPKKYAAGDAVAEAIRSHLRVES